MIVHSDVHSTARRGSIDVLVMTKLDPKIPDLIARVRSGNPDRAEASGTASYLRTL